eukprot:s228_g5.t1
MPAAPSPARELFEKLADDFKFDRRVVDRIMDLKLESLSDFRHYVTEESELEKAFIDGVADLPNPRVQLSRVRHAWSSCVAEAKVGEVRKQTEASRHEDEEAVLPSDKLEELKTRFWQRYHLCLTPSEWPSDRLLSRLAKSMDKRNLEVMDLWTVKSLLHQKSSVGSKRRRVGDNLYVQDSEEDSVLEGGTDLAAYFQRMRIYFMGLAVVGASPCRHAPASPEGLGADSTEYVTVPWDLLLKYCTRAETTAANIMASASRLGAIQKLDLEERGEWCHRFSTQVSKSLGTVIKEVFVEREALWKVAVAPGGSRAPPEPVLPPATRTSSSTGSGLKIVSQLRDRTRLCQAFNAGTCNATGRECSQGAHRCGHLLKGGRVCGSFGHNGLNCSNKQKA